MGIDFEGVYHEALKAWNLKAKPKGALGRLEDLTAKLAAIWGSLEVPEVKPGVVVFAADHGVVEEGISAYPKEVTALMLKAFVRGGACISVLCASVGARLWVSDVGVDADTSEIPGVFQDKIRRGSANFLKGPALNRDDAKRALEVGEAYAKRLALEGLNLGIGGEMGIGNTTPSATLIAFLLGLPANSCVGLGSGLDAAGYNRKLEVVKEALKRRRPDPKDPIGVLSELGGLEIAALTGFYAGLYRRRIPIVLDGVISLAAFLTARLLEPNIDNSVFFGHLGREEGSKAVMERFHQTPILALDMALGEGTGAILAASLLQHAWGAFRDMINLKEVVP
jgi:nicotinate-nucleotide--dimethylbenzimidazole phosphoribosyltransferase